MPGDNLHDRRTDHAPCHPGRAQLGPDLAPPPDGDPPAALAQRPPKVLVTKVGLDGHDRGSRLVEALPKNDTGKVLKTELRGWAETPEPD